MLFWCVMQLLPSSHTTAERRLGLNSNNPVSTFWFFFSVTMRAFSELPHHWLDPKALPLFSLDCAAKPSCQPMWRGQQNVRHLNSREKRSWRSTQANVNLTEEETTVVRRTVNSRREHRRGPPWESYQIITERIHVKKKCEHFTKWFRIVIFRGRRTGSGRDRWAR